MEPTERDTLALGWLSAELAARADAWNGNAPKWFPEPPEWIELWQRGLDATADVALDAARSSGSAAQHQVIICDRCGQRLPFDITIEHYCSGSAAQNQEDVREWNKDGWACLYFKARSPQDEDHETPPDHETEPYDPDYYDRPQDEGHEESDDR